MKIRETRLIDKSTFDDPEDSCPAGSILEYDLLCEWDRGELVETIQELDQKVWEYENKIQAQWKGNCEVSKG
jgi:hypothetical protein